MSNLHNKLALTYMSGFDREYVCTKSSSGQRVVELFDSYADARNRAAELKTRYGTVCIVRGTDVPKKYLPFHVRRRG